MLLSIRHEDSILECLKYIWQNNPAELFQTEFQIGDENLNFGTIHLIDALSAIISTEQDELSALLLKLNNPMDDAKQQQLAAGPHGGEPCGHFVPRLSRTGKSSDGGRPQQRVVSVQGVDQEGD